MPCTLGLSVGESFAELASLSSSSGRNGSVNNASSGAASGPDVLFRSRWHLSRKSLRDGLIEAFSDFHASLAPEARSEACEFTFASSVTERAVRRGEGQAPAILVTEGYKSIFRLPAVEGLMDSVSPSAKLTPAVIDEKYIYEVKARMGADGVEVTGVDATDLEKIKAKLSSADVQHVAVAFVNANVNPAHELEVAEILGQKSLHCYTSHSIKNSAALSVFDRWTKTVELAFAGLADGEESEQIDEALATSEVPLNVHLADLHHRLEKPEDVTALHFGFDQFCLLKDGTCERLPLSITQMLKKSSWLFPGWDDESVGFQPGPMLMGKSHQVCLLDVLYILDRLQAVEGFTTLISDKTRPRIEETLLAMGKDAGLSNPGSTARLDAKQIAFDIESSFIEKLDRLAFGHLEPSREMRKSKVELQGPFATTFAPLLRARRPDLDFVVSANAEWAESMACARELS